MKLQRRLVRLACAGGLAVMLALAAGCGGDSSSESSSENAEGSGDCKTLRLFTWEGYADPSFVKPFETEHGITIKPTYMGSGDEGLAKMVAGGTDLYDVVSVTSDIRAAMKEAGVIKPIDTGRLENYEDTLEFTRAPFVLDDETWAVPQDWGVNPFLYDTSALPEPPTSWDILWDSRLKNQVGLWNDYSTIYIGASVLGYDTDPEAVFNLSDEQLEAIKEKMLQLKPQVRKIWSTGGDLIQLFASGEVTAAISWTFMYAELKKEGKPVEQVVFDHAGAQGYVDANGLSAGISDACEDLAYEWIDYLLEPETQAQIATVTANPVANPDAVEFMPEDLVALTGMDDPEKVLGGAIMKLDPADREKYQKTAQEIIAGLGG